MMRDVVILLAYLPFLELLCNLSKTKEADQFSCRPTSVLERKLDDEHLPGLNLGYRPTFYTTLINQFVNPITLI